MPTAHSSARGQTSLEYLLLLAVVAVIVIASFGPGSLISKVHDSALSYYNTITRVIMGENPKQPIHGGWCPVTCSGNNTYGATTMYAACECPAPAFGGLYCGVAGNPNPTYNIAADGSVDCASQGVHGCSCPNGQTCGAVTRTTANPSGCGCPNKLTCGQPNDGTPPGSIPDITCTKCICPQGSYYDGSACATCGLLKYGPPDDETGQCTTYNGNNSCAPVKCATNMSCDPTLGPGDQYYNNCECNKGTYFNGSGCVSCPLCQEYDDGLKKCVDKSAKICPTSGNWTCTPAAGPSNLCQCWQGYEYDAASKGCIVCPGGACPTTCTPHICPVINGISNTCGPDTCGNANGCGTCNSPNAPTCDLGPSSKTYGKCICLPGTGCGSNTCGPDACGNPNGCGTCVPAGVATCNQGTCSCAKQCTGKQCGYDGCAGSCGTCPAGQECNGSTCCTPNCNGKACGDDGCGNPNGCGKC